MKVYGITNPGEFVKKIAALCKGTVELVSENGMHMELTNGKKTADMMELSYIKGSINEMELCFCEANDCVSIMNYLGSMQR